MEPVHMIDAGSNFCKANVDAIIERSDKLSDPNAPYAVVSIVGAQSSGKSYLMNQLFETKFPVMNAKLGWSQTSRGVMMSSCTVNSTSLPGVSPSLILLDVEGFDGREQGEDTLFEKRAALFALVVSDLMMINMLVTDIGREQGGAKPLFRTIFQERSKFQQGITKLLVVIRRYDGETPIERLRRDVLDSMEKMWKSVNMESVQFKDYIEVNIVALPEKKDLKFIEEVTTLKRLISNNTSAKIPASGFSLSSGIYWDTIKKNKDLDIPSHQVAVAKIYCRQLVEDIIKSLNFRQLLKDRNSQESFEDISHKLVENSKAGYDQKTTKYDTDIKDEEGRYLVERLKENFHIAAEEIKEHENKKTENIINLSVSAATFGLSALGCGLSLGTGMTAGLGASVRNSLVRGDFFHPVANAIGTVRNLVSVAKDHISDLPSTSLDQRLAATNADSGGGGSTLTSHSTVTTLAATPPTCGASTSHPPIP